MPQTAQKCLDAISESLEREQDWRKEARETIKTYKMGGGFGGGGQKDAQSQKFNILQPNTQILSAALFSNTPRPSIRPRWTSGRPSDPVERCIVEVLERAISYFLDSNLGRPEFSALLSGQVRIDYLITGRMVTRVTYNPIVENEEVKYQDIQIEPWDWEDYCHSEARRWSEVIRNGWVSYRHWMNEEDIEREFPKAESLPTGGGNKQSMESGSKGREGYKKDRSEVWELWDFSDKTIKWCADGHEGYLRTEEDYLKIPGFLNAPPPLLSVTSDDLEPIPEYRIYKALADELEQVQSRLSVISRAIKVGGLYHAQIAEFEKVFRVGDGEYYPAENITALRDVGGLKEALMLLPIEEYIQSLVSLSGHREALKQLIYELTGISDIVRGSTNPGETAFAQQLKLRNSAMRIVPRQKELAYYSREIIRIMAAIIGQHFEPHVLEAITGINPQERFGITWEQVIPVMRNELFLSYAIDIETDSTIEDMLVTDRAEIKDLLSGIVGFIQGMTVPVQTGAVPIRSAKDMLLAAARKYRVGSELEDAIEAIGEAA